MIFACILSGFAHCMGVPSFCHSLSSVQGCLQNVDDHGDSLPRGAVARMGSLRFRHGSGISSVSFSPDGKTVASAGDTWMKIWDVPTGRLLRTIGGHEDSVLSLSYSGLGDRLVSASADHSVRVWEASSGKELRRILVTGGFTEGVYDVRAAFSPNGQEVATFAGDDTVRVWNLSDGKERVRLKGQAKARTPLYAAFSPDGKTLCWGGGDSKVRFLDLESVKPVFEFDGGEGSLQGIAYSPKGELVSLLRSDNTILVWDQSSRSKRTQLSGLEGSTSTVFSPDGKLIASGGKGCRIRVWDVESGQQRTWGRLDRSPGPRICSVSFSPDGKVLASGDDWGRIVFWDTLSGKERDLIGEGHGGPVSSVSFTSDGNRLLTGSWDGGVRVWEMASGKPLLNCKGHEDIVTFVAEVPFSNSFLSGCARNILRVWDFGQGVEVRNLKKPYPDFLGVSYARSMDGHAIAMTFYHGEPSVFVLDARTGRETLRSVSAIQDVGFPAFSNDGKSLAVVHGGEIKLLEVATAKVRDSIPLGGRSVRSLAFSPDGETIATTDEDGHVSLWNVAAAKALLTFSSGVPHATVAFSPDGRMLAIAGSDHREIKFWEAGSSKSFLAFSTESSGVLSISFSPDGRKLASGNLDATGLIWDVVPLVRTVNREKPDSSKDWRDLLAEGGPDVYRTMKEMASDSNLILPFLREQLVNPKLRTDEVMKMVEALDSDNAETREKAERAVLADPIHARV